MNLNENCSQPAVTKEEEEVLVALTTAAVALLNPGTRQKLNEIPAHNENDFF